MGRTTRSIVSRHAEFFSKHDVTLLVPEIAVHCASRAYDFCSRSFSANPRQDYLFQNGFANPDGRRTVADMPNLTPATLGISPR